MCFVEERWKGVDNEWPANINAANAARASEESRQNERVAFPLKTNLAALAIVAALVIALIVVANLD